MSFQIKEYPHLQFGSIYCIGRNYAKHAAEMDSDVPETPVVFLKPRSSIIRQGEPIRLPSDSNNVHHEVELVALIGSVAIAVKPSEALNFVEAIGAGIDLTARDLQAEAKKYGLPWSLAKGFNTFAPLGNLIKLTDHLDPQNLSIRLMVNGEIRQEGHTSDMIFSLQQIISYLSARFTLYPGDLIFTGTPEGVGSIQSGDRIEATIGDHLSILRANVQ